MTADPSGTINPRDAYGIDRRRRWITTRDAATITSLSTKEIIRLIDRGDIPGLRIGRAVRIPLAEFDAWLAGREAEATRYGGAKARIA